MHRLSLKLNLDLNLNLCQFSSKSQVLPLPKVSVFIKKSSHGTGTVEASGSEGSTVRLHTLTEAQSVIVTTCHY